MDKFGGPHEEPQHHFAWYTRFSSQVVSSLGRNLADTVLTYVANIHQAVVPVKTPTRTYRHYGRLIRLPLAVHNAGYVRVVLDDSGLA